MQAFPQFLTDTSRGWLVCSPPLIWFTEPFRPRETTGAPYSA